MLRLITCFVLLFSSIALAQAGPEDGKFPPPKPPPVKWIDLLAGKLEENWTDMNCSLADSFQLKTDESGVHVLYGTGRPIGLIRSMRPYENFIMDVDWRHLTEAPNSRGTAATTGNSGLYVWADPINPPGNPFTRAVEVQICNLGNGRGYTSHGDIFPIHGATMIPDPRFGRSGDRSMPIEFRARKTGEWNHARIACVDGTIQQELNGALVTAGYRSSPRKGYLCIESEGGPVEFKNMRLAELSGNPNLQPGQVAHLLAEGTRTTCLFNGLNLNGWTLSEPDRSGWKVNDRLLRCAADSKCDLTRSLPKGDFTLIIDFSNEKETDPPSLPVSIDGLVFSKLTTDAVYTKGYNRFRLQMSDGKATLDLNTTRAISDQLNKQTGDVLTLRLRPQSHGVHFCNMMLLQTPPSP